MELILASLIWAAAFAYQTHQWRKSQQQLIEIFIPPAPTVENEDGMYDVVRPTSNDVIDKEVNRRIDEEVNLVSKPHFVRG